MFRHNLGDQAKDIISGLTGIITSRAEHLTGCARYWLSPQETKDGKPCDGAWFDEDMLEVLEANAIKMRRYRVYEEDVIEKSQPPMRRAGGPSSQPSSQSRRADR